MSQDLQTVQHTEELMVRNMMTRIAEYLHDAVHVREVRDENKELREALSKHLATQVDLEWKLAVNEDSRKTQQEEIETSRRRINDLQAEVYRLGHLLDTIRGIVINNQTTLAA